MTVEPAPATILFVEDTRELAVVIARAPEAEGYRVLRAGEGRAALALRARQRPDLAIRDWMLPGMRGQVVVREGAA